MNIGVIGQGTNGSWNMAQVASANGCNVFLFDANSSQTEKALQNLKQTLTKLAEKQKISVEESEQIFSRVKFCTTLQELKDSDLVIEAIIENKEIKTKVFSELEDYVSDIYQRFELVFIFSPLPLMPLVEIIPGLLTNEQLPQKVYDLMKSWKKVPVIAKDIPGFIVNRIARPYYGEALRIVEENIATPQQVDDAMTSLGNFRMGPFELMDLIGIDVNFAVTTTVYKDYFYDPKYKPSLLQQRMAEAKLLGRKTNRGFYDYREGAVKSVAQRDDVLYEKIFIRIISMLVNEAVEAKRLSIANDEDIELAMQKGVNYPKGLLSWGQEIGYKTISETLQNLHDEYQEERYRQSPLLDKI
ncbi:hypothetical protein FQR65_LT18495 [Abscondita terminalis]|nr:hypothetical protein FQR65_LT18495 [Abscondita terminalis]